MSSILYIGSFPPPYGGVTVKNALLFEALSEHVDIERLDLMDVKALKPRAVATFLAAVLGRKGTLVIGVSADWRRRITDLMYLLNRKKMRRSLLFVMGGKVPDNAKYIHCMGYYKRMYVETESMREAFEAAGAQNVSVYPNCRKRPASPCQVRKTVRGGVRVVFFSLVSVDKGARLALDAAGMLPNVEFHFYGRVEPAFEREFAERVESLGNAAYHGVFDSVKGDVLAELNQYDLHLFPTMCPNEGVPGVIVETKLAAVPTVASARGYNAELIEDGVDGVLIHECSAQELAGIIGSFAEDPACVDSMKAAALESAERFCVDRYLNRIVSDMPEGAMKR